jgi:hypothetical protein
MTDIDLQKFSYLWDGTNPGWVLLRAPNLRGGFCIYNKIGRSLLHVESSELNKVLCERLKEKGIEILEAVPPGEVVVKPSVEKK